MEDDGLLLNFTTSPSPGKLSAKKLAALQGKKPSGSWRERRDAKRAAAQTEPSTPGSVSKAPRTRPLSGASSRHESRGESRHETRGESHAGRSARHNDGSRDGSRDGRESNRSEVPKSGIVSSLFSYNPAVQAPTQETEPSSASTTNAPIKGSGFAVNETMETFLTSKLGLEAPTQIQRAALPAISAAIRSKQDAVMVAQTGSGKTLAYLLPILDHLMTLGRHIDRTSGVFAVILAPTRELASQIYQVCEDVCRCCHYIVPGLVIGGEKKKSEKARLRKGVNILIGTPGRMADHVGSTERLSFLATKYVVLDEGDRLIDLGFEETLTQILAAIPKMRTTVLCSATMNAQASRLKTLALSDPIAWVHETKDEDKTDDRQENTPGQLVQRMTIVPAKLRLVTLAARLKQIGARSKRAVVFFSCTDSVDFHFAVFNEPRNGKVGPVVFRLHGNLTQQQRAQTISEFSRPQAGGPGKVLLTTDVASRGLDVTVDEVLEYDPPFTIEDHLHRAGRTARAGRKGEALMFLLPSEQAYETRLREVHPGGVKSETYQSLLQRGFGFSDWQDSATSWQLGVEKAVIANEDAFADLAKRAFTAHVRAYTTHSHAEKHIFNFRELHLGHLAKAFALRETPKSITGASSGSGSKPSKQKHKSPRQAMLEAAERQLSTDEYNIM